MTRELTVVFVHGWSVRHTDTYGGLPKRLVAEASARGWSLDVQHVFLGRYVSFHDEVTVADIAESFGAALDRAGLLDEGRRFCAVTHSTGGPVVREWLARWRSRARDGARCPLSHLVQLAPASFGSALATLGRGRLGRVKAFLEAGVEPGTGVLDWLELGSPDAWALGEAWIRGEGVPIAPDGCFPFVLTGQSIDRKLYDHLNSYTGELGSDGVVRVAAANLNARLVRLVQEAPRDGGTAPLHLAEAVVAPRTAFKLVPGASHSGKSMGILRSVTAATDRAHPTVDAVLACLDVETDADYEALCDRFELENSVTEAEEREETTRVAFFERTFVHTPRTMVVFRVRDARGVALSDFDLTLLAPDGRGRLDPNALPRGFFVDRQLNSHHPGTLTYFLDHERMAQAKRLGLRVVPRPDSGFAHYERAELASDTADLAAALRPHATTLVDVVLRRVVHANTFELDRGVETRGFKSVKPGDPLP